MVSGKIAQALEHSIGKELDKSVDKDVVQVGFKRLTEDAVIPTKAHASDSGFDIVASADVIIEPGETAVVPTGIAVQLPEGYEASVRPRSGVTSRTKLRVQYGTVDFGYNGEIGVITDNIETRPLWNAFYLGFKALVAQLKAHFIDGEETETSETCKKGTLIIRKGDRIAQLVITRLSDVESVEVFDVGESERGDRGFGSSGVSSE